MGTSWKHIEHRIIASVSVTDEMDVNTDVDVKIERHVLNALEQRVLSKSPGSIVCGRLLADALVANFEFNRRILIGGVPVRIDVSAKPTSGQVKQSDFEVDATTVVIDVAMERCHADQ